MQENGIESLNLSKFCNIASNFLDDEALTTILRGLYLHKNLMEIYLGRNIFEESSLSSFVENLPMW